MYRLNLNNHTFSEIMITMYTNYHKLTIYEQYKAAIREIYF